MAEDFCLRWNDHHPLFFRNAENLCEQNHLTDVTLSCGKRQFAAHKLVLSVCSGYFAALFATKKNSIVSPFTQSIVYMKDVPERHMELILSFMYRGEIHVQETELMSLLETAKGLQVRGLSEADDEELSSSKAPKRSSAAAFASSAGKREVKTIALKAKKRDHETENDDPDAKKLKAWAGASTGPAEAAPVGGPVLHTDTGKLDHFGTDQTAYSTTTGDDENYVPPGGYGAAVSDYGENAPAIGQVDPTVSLPPEENTPDISLHEPIVRVKQEPTVVDPTRCLEESLIEGEPEASDDNESLEEEEEVAEDGSSTNPPPAGVKVQPPPGMTERPPFNLNAAAAVVIRQATTTPLQQEKSAACNPNAKFVCQYCNKRFVHKWMMDRHLTSHTGARPYKCISCARRFSLQSSAVRHVKNVHKDSISSADASSFVVKDEDRQFDPDGEFSE